MIVLNENDWAHNAIEERTLGEQPYETIHRVARYYLDEGYSKKDTRKMLDQFLLMCEPTASLPKWSGMLDFALDRATKRAAICKDNIAISKAELASIATLESKQAKRLAFTLLCLAKYWDLVNPGGDHWVNNKDNEIMRMANVNTSIKRQSILYAKLKEAGLIQFSRKVDNTNVRVCFIRDGDAGLYISDFRNLGYQYLKYCGEPFFVCESCGLTVRANDSGRGRKQKYCKRCATEISTRQKVNSVMRRRQSADCTN